MTAGIIDVHMHLGAWPEFYNPGSRWQEAIWIMDRLGIEKCISCHPALLLGEFEVGWKESVEAYEGSEGRILSYTFFNPHYPLEFSWTFLKPYGAMSRG